MILIAKFLIIPKMNKLNPETEKNFKEEKNDFLKVFPEKEKK
jgi:hypothetical protein